MFGLFKKDPKKKLDQEYLQLLEQAMQAQRNGDIRTYSELTEKAEAKRQEIEALGESSQAKLRMIGFVSGRGGSVG